MQWPSSCKMVVTSLELSREGVSVVFIAFFEIGSKAGGGIVPIAIWVDVSSLKAEHVSAGGLAIAVVEIKV